MHPSNKAKFDYARIPLWWSKGYTGKGVKVAVFEDTSRGHGYYVADILKQVAPDAEVLSRPRPLIVTEADRMTPDTAERMTAFYKSLVAEGVNIIVMSLSGTGTSDIEELEKAILHRGGITMLTCAGNDGDDIEPYKSAYLDTWIAVGAADLVNGVPKRVYYSETGSQLDVMGFTDLYASNGMLFNGTSCAAPFVTGMLALYFQYHKEKMGRFPTFEESYKFITSNAEDMETKGFDEKTAYGLFGLPESLPKLEVVEVKSMINDFQIAKNFKLREFQSKDTCEVKVEPELVQRLQALRDKLGKPITVLSGYRTPEHNAKVGGAPASKHMLGQAADIYSPGVHVDTIAKLAKEVGFRGIGIYRYQNFVHVDIRPVPALWEGDKGDT